MPDANTSQAHQTVLQILFRAIELTKQTIEYKDTRLIDYKPLERLKEEDLSFLTKALERMERLWKRMNTQKQSEDCGLDLIATDKCVLERFASLNIFSVIELQTLDRTTLTGILQQYEEMGMRGHQHLYFF